MIRGVSGVVLASVAACLLGSAPALAAPANDDFANAEAIGASGGLPAVAHGSNVGATSEVGEPTHDNTGVAHNSVWYSWSTDEREHVIVDTCGSGFETAVAVYVGSGLGDLKRVAGGYPQNRAVSCGSAEGGYRGSTRFAAQAGETYWIAVDGRNGQTGSIELGISTGPETSVSDASVVEGSGGSVQAVFEARLDAPKRWVVWGSYSTRDLHSATPDVDYVTTLRSARFEPGETRIDLEVEVWSDGEVEGDETFGIHAGFSPGAPSSLDATATIVDDDYRAPPPAPLPPGCFSWGCPQPGFGPVRMSTSGDRSEIVKSIPIKRRGGARTVMRIGPKSLTGLGAGDVLETSAELEVSVTCRTASPRCVGSRYRYDPLVGGRITLGDGGGPGKRAVLSRDRLRCSQSLPHRNHHCVLVFGRKREALESACRRCSLELELSARHRRARPGNRLVIGSDAHGGVEGDRGRLNAAVIGEGAPAPAIDVTRRPQRRTVPVAGRSANTRKRVIISARFDDLAAHEQIAVEALARVRTSHLRYSTFVGSMLVVANRRGAVTTSKRLREAAVLQGEVSEKNGFNCTRGRSAHDNPCVIHKVGFVRTRRPVSGPLYVNLVAEAGARWGGRYRRGDKGRVLEGASLRSWRYGPLGWVKVAPLPSS